MENLDPRLPPKSRMGKWRVFALRAASSLIWGGWGFAVPFYFVQDCSTGDDLKLTFALIYSSRSSSNSKVLVYSRQKDMYLIPMTNT